jgi:hypothetical protein
LTQGVLSDISGDFLHTHPVTLIVVVFFLPLFFCAEVHSQKFRVWSAFRKKPSFPIQIFKDQKAPE